MSVEAGKASRANVILSLESMYLTLTNGRNLQNLSSRLAGKVRSVITISTLDMADPFC